MQSRLLTMLLALVTASTLIPVASAHAAPSYDDRVRITFPVAGSNSYRDSYDAGRSGGRTHQATDVMANSGQRVHAAIGGTVTWITGLDGNPPSYGYMIRVDGDDGRDYSYIHLGRQDKGPGKAYAKGIKKGARVQRGQHIGYVGCSGNASCSAPHLHFEIEDPRVTDPYGTSRMNPYRSLKWAESRGDVPGKGRFFDVRPSNTHFDAVEGIAAAGITKGCTRAAYCPKPSVTRAEMASFLARTLGLSPVDADQFDDIDHTGSHRRNINAVAKAGVTQGCGDGSAYCPDDFVTRAEMATFLKRAFDTPRLDDGPFSDIDGTGTHRKNINGIERAGITKGCASGRYCPDESVSREQMASFLDRARRR